MIFRLFVMPVLFALAGCSALPYHTVAPKVSVAEVGIRSLGLFEQHFDVGLKVANANDFDLEIEAVDFELEVNGRPLAKGESRSGLLIPAASSTVVRVEAVMQSQDLLEQIQTLQSASLKEGIPYRIRGRVKTGGSLFSLPFDHRGTYGGEAKPPAGRAV